MACTIIAANTTNCHDNSVCPYFLFLSSVSLSSATSLFAGEKWQANPTWSVNSVVQSTVLTFGTTLTTAGTFTIDATRPTTWGRTFTGETSITVNPDQPPIASMDCSNSHYDSSSKSWVLSCTSTSTDPDGTIKGLTWYLPDINYTNSGSLTINRAFAPAIAVTVQLTVTDNSGSQTTAQQTVDLTVLH